MKKRWLSILLVLALTVVLAVPAMAADQVTDAAGLEAAAAGGDVKLDADITLTGDVQVTGNLVLDLNGHDITGGKLVVNGGKLYLMDSATSAYTSTDFGTVAVEGDVVPAFVAADGRRYIAIKDGDTYSAHRIYLAVKSVVLSPSKVGVNYKLILNCSEYVASQVTAYGAYFGTDAATITSGAPAVGKTSVSAAASAGNPVVIQVQGQSEATLNTNILASAFITLKSGTTITSAAKGMSYANAVATLDADFASLSEAEQINRVNYYEAHADLLSSLNLTMGNYKAHCICASHNGTHIGDCTGAEMLWKPHTLTGSNALPNTAGNWYLVENDGDINGSVAVAAAGTTFSGGPTVNIDMNGLNVTSAGARAINGLNGGNLRLTITDSSTGYAGKITSTVTGTGTQGNIFWFRAGQTLVIYRIELDASRVQSNTTAGGTVVNADGGNTVVKMFDATVRGGKLLNTAGNGAAIHNSGSLTLNNTDVYGNLAATGGAAISNGGNLTIENESHIYGCTAQEIGATANGGTIYMSKGSTTVDNSIVEGSYCKNGTAFYISGGTLTLNNNASVAAETLDAFTPTNGGAIYATGGTAKITLNDGTVTGTTVSGNGGTVYLALGADLIVDGGNVKGGTATKGGAVYGVNNEGTTLDMRSGAIYDGVATSDGGNVYLEAGADFVMSGGRIYNGKGSYVGNVQVDHQTICTFAMSGGEIYSPANGRNVHANVASFTLSGDAKIYDGQVCVFRTITLDTWNGNGLTSGGQRRPVQIFVNNGTVGTVLVTGTSNVNVSDYFDQFYLAGGEYDLAVSGNTLIYAEKAAQ